MTLAAVDPPRKDRLERFRSIRAKLDPTGDPASAISALYVDSPHSVSARLAAELAIAPGSCHLLVGGVGSGKTTELLAVTRHMASLADTAAYYIDVSKRHDIAKMVPGAVMSQVGLTLAEQVARIEPKNEAVRGAHEVAHEAWEYSEWEPPPPPGADYVPGILVPEPVHENIRRAQIPLEGLLEVIRRQVQHVVFVLDGLDRIPDIQAFEQLVVHDIKALSSLGVGTVLVGPLRTMYGIDRVLTQYFDSIHYQPWIDVTANAAGREFLVGVLLRRAGEVLDGPGIDALVDASGGVLRDLLSLAQSALVEAYMAGSDSIGSHEVGDAVDAFGRKHLQGLRPAELEVLQRVRTQGTFVQTSEDDLALLMTRRVLEYRNRNQPRYAVHPTIEGLLRDLEGK